MTSTNECEGSFIRRLCSSFLFILILCLTSATAAADVSISNNTIGTATLTGVGGSANFNFNHTTTAGTNRMLLVSVSMNVNNSTAAAITAVTYNGVALTSIGGATGNSQRRVEFWGLINPPVGTFSVVVTSAVQTGRAVGVVASATTLTGVDQTTPVGTAVFATASSTAPSVTVTSAAGDLVVDRVAILQGTATITPGGGQTAFSAATNSGATANDVRGASSSEAGSASVTMSETLSGGGQRWEIGGVPIKPAIADLVTTATALSPDPVPLNGTTSTTFTITNNGPQAATGATFTITLPGSITNPVATPSSGSCSGTGPITCSFPSIANGGSVTVALSVTAPTAGIISITGTADDTVEYDPPANSAATITAKAQSPCATPGDDGAGGTLTGIVNSYFPGTSTGTGTITVGAGAGANVNISSGDLLLVIQMQDADINSTNTANYGANSGTGAGYTNLNSAGRYEFVVATSGITFGTGGTVNVNGGGPGGTLINTYTNAAATGTQGASRFQVVRVPQYSSPTLSSGLTAAAWNGATGGILAIDVAGTLTLGGTVSVDAKGFRGGGGRSLGGVTGGTSTDYVRAATLNANGSKGEGIAGTPRYVYNGALVNTGVEGLPTGANARGAPGNAGGGGTDANQGSNDQNSGGGGGSNGGTGGRGGNSWSANVADGGFGGVALPADQSHLFMGGGGGAGTSNNGTSDPNTNTTGLNSSGAIGGGIVFIRAAEIIGTGTITANGASALNVQNDGAGGGGAGGTIVVVTKFGNLSGLTLGATGGDGGNAWAAQAPGTCSPVTGSCNYHGPGGAGGGGVILTSSAVASADVSGGANGITTTAANAFNSAPGSAGATSTSAVFTAIPGSDSSAECAPDLSATKTGNGPWIRGTPFSFALGVSNLGILDTSGAVTFTDTLPIGMVPTAASGSGWLCSVASQTVACNRNDTLSTGQSYPSITINGTVGQTTADAVTNTATASGGGDLYSGNNSPTYSSAASSIADLFVTSIDSPDPVSAGGSITYTQTVGNSGPSDAGNATFSTTVPANTGFQSITVPSGWSCVAPATNASGTVTCATNYLAAGSTTTFVFVTKLNAGVTSGTLTNIASVSSIAADSNLANNAILSTTTVGTSPADVTLTNAASPSALTAGSNITFTQVVRNQGSSAATTVTFSEPIPANTTFQSFTNPGWTCSTPSVGGSGTISCSIASLAAGGTATFNTVVQVNGASASGTVITDTTTVGAANDSLTTNNSATATAVVTLGSQSDLVVTNVASAPQIYAGNHVTFIQAIANNGPAIATNVNVSETVPAGTTFTSVTPPPGWSCTAPVSGSFTCSTSTLAVGASATVLFDVLIPSNTVAGTTITDTVTATASNGDPNTANSTNIAATTKVITGANLIVTNTLGSGSDPTTAGGSYSLAQTVSNAGPSDSGTITLTETIPANVTVGSITVPAGWACGAQVGSTITCTGPNLAPGAAALNFTVPLTVNAGAPTSTLLAETMNAQPATPEVIPANNVSTYTNSVAGGTQADLAITATSTPLPAVAGQNLTYSGTIVNKGPASASTVTFTLPVPANTTFVSFIAPAGATCTTPSVGGTGTVSCTAATVPINTPGTVQLVVKVNAGAVDGSSIITAGTLSGTTSDPNSTNNSATASVGVIRESDLSISNVDSPDPLNTTVSNVITYTQVITNNGPSDAANIVVTETVPSGTTFGSVTTKPAGWNCTAPSGGVFTCTGPSLAVGANGTIIFTVTNTTTGKLTQTATVSSDSLELNAADNTASAVTTIATGTQSDMQVTVTAGSPTVNAGSNVAFTAVVTNRGPATATSITVTLPIPPNSTYQSLSFPGGWTCPTPAVGSTGTITCTIASIAANATAAFVLTVKADATADPNTVIGETASVALGTPANDPDSTNNSATASSRATNPTNADVSVTLGASPTSVKTGEPFTLTSVVPNAGPASATGVTLTIPFTPSEQFVSVTSTQGTCTFTGGSVVCSLDTIASGGSATINIVANAIAIGDTTNTASVIANENDPTPANNSASVSLAFSSPTAVRLVSFHAISTDGSRIVVEWRTREEVRNLGFNIYREGNGERVKLNNSIIAGAAVRSHVGMAQHSASAYKWIDDQPVPGAMYLIEDVSVSGVRTWNGPVGTEAAASFAPSFRLSAKRSATLRELSTQASQAPIPFNPVPVAGIETTAGTLPGWASIQTVQIPIQTLNKADLDLVTNRAKLKAPQTPARLESSWFGKHTAAKISVDHQGWYRVAFSQLSTVGYLINNSANLHLYAEGLEVPILVNSSGKGSIEFYGTGLDTPYTGTRVYWLVESSGSSLRIQSSNAGGKFPTASGYLATIEKRDRAFYFAALTNNGDQDNFFGDVIAGAPIDQHLTLANVDAQGASTAKVFVCLQGATDSAHHVQVSVNGMPLGDITWSGMNPSSLTQDVPIGTMLEGDNVITLTPLGGDDDVSAVDHITITYPRAYAAVQNQFMFTVPARTTVKLTGFNAPARIFQQDTASIINAKFTSQPDGTYAADFNNADSTLRTYYAFTDGAVQSASSVASNVVSQWSANSNSADVLIVAHQDFIPALTPLLNLRRQQGYRRAVINIEDVYDEFNYGENSPQALRDLLTTASFTWRKAPKWLLLVGDASLDPRNFLGTGSFDFVPTKIISTAQMKTSSDGWFSDFQETGLPQVATGRLPVRTPEEATALVSKIVGYDQQSPGPWTQQALLVTDENIGSDFSGETAKIASLLPASLKANVINFGSDDQGTVRSQLIDQLNSGQLLVNYLGHGSVEVWAGSGILNGDDASNLTNGSHLPFVVSMDCLNGFFHDVYQTSLAESLLLSPSGGASAVWASSGLTEPESQFVMDKNLVQYLFANPSITIGEATTKAKSGVADMDVKRTWNLFGDPTMKLRSEGN